MTEKSGNGNPVSDNYDKYYSENALTDSSIGSNDKVKTVAKSTLSAGKNVTQEKGNPSDKKKTSSFVDCNNNGHYLDGIKKLFSNKDHEKIEQAGSSRSSVTEKTLVTPPVKAYPPLHLRTVSVKLIKELDRSLFDQHMQEKQIKEVEIDLPREIVMIKKGNKYRIYKIAHGKHVATALFESRRKDEAISKLNKMERPSFHPFDLYTVSAEAIKKLDSALFNQHMRRGKGIRNMFKKVSDGSLALSKGLVMINKDQKHRIYAIGHGKHPALFESRDKNKAIEYIKNHN